MTTATTLAAQQRRTYAHRSASTIFRSASRLKPSTTESSRRPWLHRCCIMHADAKTLGGRNQMLARDE